MVEQCWENGMDIESEDEYVKACSSLTETLMSSNNQVQLAEKLAQHIFYVVELKRTAAVQVATIEKLSRKLDLLDEAYQQEVLKNKILRQDAVTIAKETAMIAINAKQCHSTKQRMEGGLDPINERKGVVQELARSIATELWQSDFEKKIRIMEMADLVYRALNDRSFSDVLPDTVERVKDWIKPVAPEYARMGGRRSKKKGHNRKTV